MTAKPLIHIDLRDYGSSGIYVTPKNIAEVSAELSIIVGIENNGEKHETAKVSVVIKDRGENVVADGSRNMEITGGRVLEDKTLWTCAE